MLGSLILYLKGRRRTMFQLSGFYCRLFRVKVGVSIQFRVADSILAGPFESPRSIVGSFLEPGILALNPKP